MKFKEFAKWCRERTHDGHWGMKEAVRCCDCVTDIYKKPFWKREKYWQNHPLKDTCIKIVEETNKIIEEKIGGKNEQRI